MRAQAKYTKGKKKGELVVEGKAKCPECIKVVVGNTKRRCPDFSHGTNCLVATYFKFDADMALISVKK